MAISFLHNLSKTARAAYPIIQRGVREGLSANRLAEVLKSQGLGLRRESLLDIVRAERGVVESSDRLRFLNQNARPNPAHLKEALTKTRRNYTFTVELRGTNKLTGASMIQHVTVATDRLLTRSEIESAGERLGQRGSDRYGIDIDTAILTRGTKAGAEGTF